MILSPEQIDKLIDIWHDDANILCELWEFMGWTKEDYSKWVKGPGFNPESDLDQAELDFIFDMKGKC